MIPTTISEGLISGVVGALSHHGPIRARTAITSTEGGVFGRVFTFDDEAVESVQQGGTGQFAGILFHPHAHKIFPEVPAGYPGEFLDMGEMFVEVLEVDEASIGDPIFYIPSTGELTIDDEGNIPVPNCRLERHLPSAETPYLAIIRLTN